MLETGSQAGRADEERGECRSGNRLVDMSEAHVVEPSFLFHGIIVVEDQDQAGHASFETAIGFSYDHSQIPRSFCLQDERAIGHL